PNLTVIEGHARFIGPYALAIDGSHTQLHASEIFINTGGRALVPDIPGLDQVDYLTNSSMMDIDFLPPHLLIIGGSYIGLEFAQMYRRFGSQVTVLENGPRIVSREDPEVSAAVQAILEKEGITIICNAKKLQAAKAGSDVVLSYGEEGQRHQVSGSHLLLAVGRIPNTQDLGLDKAGIITDARGYITVDEQLHTNVTGIWAMGDVNGRGAFTHTSYNDYEIVAANLLSQEERKISDRITAYALFIDPPLARVGMSEAEARATGRKVLKAKMMMTRVGRARERDETQGFMSVLVDAGSKKILGAALLGIEGDEAIHSILDVMYAGAPYTTITHAMHIHPTVSELIPTMLEDLKPLE
ncbi:mercuric reductase, partial [Undibacterium sp.]|uniref:mercuric reductase n=1 Tax=Undibacterium sp. TaxID=1914977 RepID=UPI00374D2A35